jgi:uncharacterized protein with HEPN domain
MSRSDDQLVADILDACDELEGVVSLRSEGQVPDEVLLRAAERLLEIIGEAASNVSDAGMNQYPVVDWRNIARLRIVLAHHYHRTDPDLIWSYAIEQAPVLASALRT